MFMSEVKVKYYVLLFIWYVILFIIYMWWVLYGVNFCKGGNIFFKIDLIYILFILKY